MSTAWGSKRAASAAEEYPDPYSLADEDDDRDWDVNQQGRMREHAAPDDAIPTVPWEA